MSWSISEVFLPTPSEVVRSFSAIARETSEWALAHAAPYSSTARGMMEGAEKAALRGTVGPKGVSTISIKLAASEYLAIAGEALAGISKGNVLGRGKAVALLCVTAFVRVGDGVLIDLAALSGKGFMGTLPIINGALVLDLSNSATKGLRAHEGEESVWGYLDAVADSLVGAAVEALPNPSKPFNDSSYSVSMGDEQNKAVEIAMARAFATDSSPSFLDN